MGAGVRVIISSSVAAGASLVSSSWVVPSVSGTGVASPWAALAVSGTGVASAWAAPTVSGRGVSGTGSLVQAVINSKKKGSKYANFHQGMDFIHLVLLSNK